MNREPVRIAALVAGVLVAASTALLALDQGQSLYFALGQALAYLGLVFGGGEIARSRAWSPASHDREIAERDLALDQIASAEAALDGVTIHDVGDGQP